MIDPAPQSQPATHVGALRDAVLAAYISSSRGIHRTLSEQEYTNYSRAYRWYLRGWLPDGAGRKWLDLGCGQGQLLKLAGELGFAANGVDASPEMLAVAERFGLKVETGDVFATLAELETGSVDVVSAFDLVEHFPRDLGFRLLQEMRRVLKPGGMALLKLPNASSPFGAAITADDLTHEAAYTPQTIVQLGTISGFAEGEVREVGPTALGLASRARQMVWRLLDWGCGLFDTIETGRRRSTVYTRVMLVRLPTEVR